MSDNIANTVNSAGCGTVSNSGRSKQASGLSPRQVGGGSPLLLSLSTAASGRRHCLRGSLHVARCAHVLRKKTRSSSPAGVNSSMTLRRPARPIWPLPATSALWSGACDPMSEQLRPTKARLQAASTRIPTIAATWPGSCWQGRLARRLSERQDRPDHLAALRTNRQVPASASRAVTSTHS